MASRFDIVLDKGSDFSLDITINNQEDDSISLIGASAEAQIRATFKSTEVLDTLKSGTNRITIQDATHLTMNFPASVTTDYTFTKGVYDLEVTFQNGEHIRLLEGLIVARDEVTK